MGIAKFHEEAKQDFEIYGLLDNEWIDFQKGINFDAFLINRK
jgi:hypothetical protein